MSTENSSQTFMVHSRTILTMRNKRVQEHDSFPGYSREYNDNKIHVVEKIPDITYRRRCDVTSATLFITNITIVYMRWEKQLLKRRTTASSALHYRVSFLLSVRYTSIVP